MSRGAAMMAANFRDSAPGRLDMNVWLHPRLHRSHCYSSSGQPVGGQSPVARHQNHRNEADFQRSDQESRHNAITLPDSTVRTPGRTLRVVLLGSYSGPCSGAGHSMRSMKRQ